MEVEVNVGDQKSFVNAKISSIMFSEPSDVFNKLVFTPELELLWLMGSLGAMAEHSDILLGAD